MRRIPDYSNKSEAAVGRFATLRPYHRFLPDGLRSGSAIVVGSEAETFKRCPDVPVITSRLSSTMQTALRPNVQLKTEEGGSQRHKGEADHPQHVNSLVSGDLPSGFLRMFLPLPGSNCTHAVMVQETLSMRDCKAVTSTKDGLTKRERPFCTLISPLLSAKWQLTSCLAWRRLLVAARAQGKATFHL